MPTDQNNRRTWLITGTSQGFGRDLVQAALDRGDNVVATSRSPGKVKEFFPGAGERLHTAAMDLQDNKQIESVVAAAIQRFGGIDVLVNNAGHGLLGAIEEANDADIARVFETNVFGLIRVTRAVLPGMRKQRRGNIVNLSSVGGLVGLPGWGIYNATKFAVEGLSEALALEVAPLGIRVTIVEPGPFRTNFLGDSLEWTAGKIADYEQTAGKTRDYQKQFDGTQAGDPVRGAKAIVDAVTSKNPPLHLLLGAIAHQRVVGKLDSMRKEIDAWKEVTLATDFPK
jgi:NAD(P)-dependent dehydrogenase (short-subunit alcohol dehydrogenase family)